MYVCILPCVYLCGCAYAVASLWRSEDLRSQLSFHLVGPGHQIKWSGLAASTFISCAILLGSRFFFMVVGSYHLIYSVCDGQPEEGPVLETTVLYSNTGWPQMYNCFSASAFQVLECVYEPLCLVRLKHALKCLQWGLAHLGSHCTQTLFEQSCSFCH